MLKAYVINMKIINSNITPPKKGIKEEIENQKLKKIINNTLKKPCLSFPPSFYKWRLIFKLIINQTFI